MQSRDYWNERFAILNKKLLKPAEELVPHIEEAYEKAINNIQKEIEAFYRRFASDNKITLREAMRKLSPTEQNRFRIEVNDYIKKASENNLDSRWVKKLKNAGIANSIDRLTALQMQMRQQIEALEAYKANGITKTLGELYKDGYYTTAYEIQKGLGVGILLEQSLERTDISSSAKRNSYHSQGKVFLKDNVPESTIAHELFHEIDRAYGITESGALQKSLENDRNRLNNIAFGYGKSVEDVILSKYPENFITGTVRAKEEIRGISDILNGLSVGKINFGYGHKIEYWSIPLKIAKETWAQFGRLLYEQNDDAIAMAKDLFPNSYNEVIRTLKGMVK